MQLKYLYLSLIVLILVLARVESQTQTKASKALEDLKNKAIQNNGMIPADLDILKKYVFAVNRPFSMMIYMTSTSPKHGCDICVAIKGDLATFAANSYITYLNSPEFDSNPVFIVLAEADRTMDLFQKLQVQTIPHIIYHPSGSSEVSMNKNFGRMETFSQDSFGEFFKQQTGVKIEIVKSFFEVHGNKFGAIAILLFAIRIVISLYRRRNSWVLWMVLSLGLVATVLSGVFYIFIHHPPLVEYNRGNNQVNYFSRNTRQQTVVEGAMMGVLTMVLAGLFIFIADLLPNKYSLTMSKSKYQSVFFVSFLAMMTCLFLLSTAFQLKYYRPFFFIPEEFRNPTLIFKKASY